MMLQTSPSERRERKRKLQKLTQQVALKVTALTTLQCLRRTTNAKIKRLALVCQQCQTTSTGRTFRMRTCSYPYVCRLLASNQITQRSQSSRGRPREINRVYLHGRRSQFFMCDDCIELQFAANEETQEIEPA